MRSRKLVIGFGLLVAVASAVPAYAQSAASGVQYPPACAASSVPSAESDKAHAIYAAGKVQYDDGSYEAAIAQFRDAYKRDCSKHDLLVIISRAYELKGDRAEAIKALELYLDREKPADAATHRTKIDNLRKQIAAQPAPPTTTAPPPEIREHTIPPWIVVGVGGVAVIVGGILLIVAPPLPPHCDKNTQICDFYDEQGTKVSIPKPPPPLTNLQQQQQNQLNKNQDTAGASVGQTKGGLITLICGIGIMGGGLLWHFLEPTGPSTSTGSIKPKVTPEVAPGYAGMSVGGSF